jgi:hypothetical protein
MGAGAKGAHEIDSNTLVKRGALRHRREEGGFRSIGCAADLAAGAGRNVLGDGVVHVRPEVILQKTFFGARHPFVTRKERGVCGVYDSVSKREGEK